jgi:serine-type D-Ala-D-Ala carboxypeptidase/endopeptidase
MVARGLVMFIAGLVLASASAFSQVPTDAEIHKVLVDRVGSENLGIGIVVGVIDSSGRRVIAYGSLAKNDNRRLDGNTVFEIGSMTKVFTSLVLMDMARRGEVALNDPISKYLPSTVKVPERNGRQITFADVSTQSSGLPRLPANMHPKDPTILTPIIPSSRCTIFCPAISSRATSAPSTNIRTWRSACWVMCFPCAPA